MEVISGDSVRWSIGKILEKWASAQGDKPALIIDDEVFTYSQLNAKANQFVHLFKAQGLQRGDRVAGVTRRTIEAVALYFACAKFGAICIPLNNRLLANELLFQLRDSEASLVLFDCAFQGSVEPAITSSGLEASKMYCIGSESIPAWCRDVAVALSGQPSTTSKPCSIRYP